MLPTLFSGLPNPKLKNEYSAMSEITFPGKASDFLEIGVAAAARGDVDSVRKILKARPAWLQRIGSHGRTMLWEASHRGKFEMVKYLVRRGADIDACGTHYTPYFVEVSCYCIARFKKRNEVADFLLKKGAKVNIHTAAFLGDFELVKSFLKKKPKLLNMGHPHSQMGDKNADGLDFYLAPAPWATPLCYALRGADVETVSFLIEKGALIKGNEDALFIAAKKNVEMVRLLLENGADAKHITHVYPDEGDLFELVTAYGVKQSEEHLDSELVYLCRGDRGGNPEEVKRLLNLGADVNFQDHKGKTALHRAARSGFIETTNILLDHGASVSIEDPAGETPLFDTIRSTIKNTDNKQEAVRLLIKAGANPLHSNRKGETPFSLAMGGKRPEMKKIAWMLGRK